MDRNGLQFLLYLEQPLPFILQAERGCALAAPFLFRTEPTDYHFYSICIQTIQSEITAMIYMRDRHSNKKKQENKEQNTTRNYLDQLKSKFAKKSTTATKDADNKPQNTRKENQLKPLSSNQKSQKYAISHSKPSGHAVSDSKFSESIIVHEGPFNPNPFFSKRPTLTTVKCFDIQIVNDLSSSRFRAQAYIQILEREKQLKNREITALKELIAAQRDKSPLKEEMEQLKKATSEKTKEIERYGRFFKEGKELFLNAVMELIDSRKELSATLSKDRLKAKEQCLSRCIERIQRVMSIYSNLVELSGKAPSEGTTVDQLWNNVKYQQKIIELMKQNESNQKVKDYHHENTLLRYEINRLSKQNEQLLKLIANQEDSLQLDYSRSYQPNIPPNRPQESIILHEQESEQIEEDSHQEVSASEAAQQTPFQQLKDHFSRSIQHPFSNLELQTLNEVKTKLEKDLSDCRKQLADCQKELSDRKTRVNILQVEKEYIQDQLQQVERSERDLKQELKALMEENEQLRETIRGLKVKPPLVQDDYEMAMESEKALGEQNDLLRDRISLLLKPNGKDTVTVEELLKLLKRKELAHYHQALMELISKYEQRISELTNSYIYERQLKQHSLTYCKGLFNIVQATSRTQDSPTLEDIIDYINKYEDIMAELRENEIDVYLRKIRSLSIGIDESAAETIKEELKDYVYQLQTRLPTLSEEYLEDGSSIADSYHNSVERFD